MGNMNCVWSTATWNSKYMAQSHTLKGNLHESGLNYNPDQIHSVSVVTIEGFNRNGMRSILICNSTRIHVNYP